MPGTLNQITNRMTPQLLLCVAQHRDYTSSAPLSLWPQSFNGIRLKGRTAIPGQGVEIGEWSVVGAGAVVVGDVPAGVTVVGVPAKILKERP